MTEWKPMNDEEHMLSQFYKGNGSRVICLLNKQPTWSCTANSYMLDFHGRVTLSSVKNFQLLYPNNSLFNQFITVDKEVVLQFGKIDDDSFSLDLAWPLSIFQAGGVALTAFTFS